MTQEEVDMYIEDAQEHMDRAIEHLHHELNKISTGKASPAVVSELLVSYYGSMTPMAQVSNVSAADARTLVIQPWEKSMLGPIEKAIFEANIGVTPMNDGQVVRLSFPPLTEERRRDLVKRAKHLGEEAKVSLRNTRRDAMEQVKKAVKAGFPEDAGKRKEEEIQDMITKYSAKVDQVLDGKEKDILTV
ncbi:MAG: ribosome recycling factor [Haliscomenobacter sp.]